MFLLLDRSMSEEALLDLLEEAWLTSPGLAWWAKRGSISGQAFSFDTKEVIRVSSWKLKKKAGL